MHLKTLLANIPFTPSCTVPDWMIGCFKRKSITFANGKTDTQTHVFWLQGRTQTIDLRLPVESDIVKETSWDQCNKEQLTTLANYEGWSADSHWDPKKGALSWSGGTSFQIHNRWPEPALLSRVGDCMIELSPQASYVEDWRILNEIPGPLLSLKLLDEVNLNTGVIRHKGGALIITGDWAGLVLGRPTLISSSKPNHQLRDELSSQKEKEFLTNAFKFETSIAKGNIEKGFNTLYSTQAKRINEPLFHLDGFEFDSNSNEVTQIFTSAKDTIKRRFSIDAIEPFFNFSKETQWQEDSKKWFEFEEDTLSRYLEPLSII